MSGPLDGLRTALREGREALGRRVTGGVVADDPETRRAASDLRVVFVLALVLYVLFTILSFVSGFEEVGAIVSRLQTVTLLVLVYVMLALALNLQWGYAGLLNLGVAGFMAVGVYTMAILSTSPDAAVPGLGLPLPVGIFGGFLAATLLGALAALPAIRLRADYLAIVTLAFSEIVRLTIRSRAAAEFTIAGQTLGTAGSDSLSLPTNPVKVLLYKNPEDPAFRAIEDPTIVGQPVFAVADTLGISASAMESTVYTFFTFLVALLFYWLLVRTGNSPFGRVLKAIREDELVASSLGKDTRRFKITAFAVGCGLMALTAMLWMLEGSGRVSPDTFVPELTFFVFVALILGGSGSNTGSVVGGIVFAAVLFEGPTFIQRIVETNFNLPSAPDTIFGAFEGVDPMLAYLLSDVNVSALRFVVLGVVLVYLMQRRPEGLFGHRTELASTIDLSERPTPAESGSTGDSGGGSDQEGDE